MEEEEMHSRYGASFLEFCFDDDVGRCRERYKIDNERNTERWQCECIYVSLPYDSVQKLWGTFRLKFGPKAHGGADKFFEPLL